MKPSRSRVEKEIVAYREMIDEKPATRHIQVRLGTLVEYCEALMAQDGSRIPIRFEGDIHGF